MRKAYLLVESMIAIIIAGIVAVVFTTMNYYSNIQSNILKQQNTKIILEVIRSRLLKLATDPDNDVFFELLKEDANQSLPVEAGVGVDAWGKRISYWTIDLGTLDATNLPYANTDTVISPNANVAGRLVSSGEDRILSTTTSDSVVQGDDLMLEIGVGELNHFKLYSGSEITTQTRAYNSAIVSDTQPLTPLNGTLWYDTTNSKLQVYKESTLTWVDVL
ncbi:hypothetical protein JHD48_04280 [Sulfurimonas sp. SAG-AH-194-I05]|nr:hypothetical protein [Sulfurimonas sp. SAG-AH-194-I05]MDF1874946.1 hypothetical protein [Sulfurimonas sp. SAG-AH-194-I05]